MSKGRSGRKARHKTSRREFLKTMMLSGGATAVALMTTREATASAPPEVKAAPLPESKGYHETPHIRDYYHTAGL